MEALAYFFVLVYVAALLFITLYALFEFQLLFYYFKKYRKLKSFKPATVTEWPNVTIQLPLFNELYVVERLIDDICKIDYPSDRLEIQVLDDSTDESIQIAKNKVEYYASRGVNIKYIHSTNRVG